VSRGRFLREMGMGANGCDRDFALRAQDGNLESEKCAGGEFDLMVTLQIVACQGGRGQDSSFIFLEAREA